jgi:hypothetical protein
MEPLFRQQKAEKTEKIAKIPEKFKFSPQKKFFLILTQKSLLSLISTNAD